jgi:sugar lactone lactonase YvrE
MRPNQASTQTVRTLMTGILLGESPRWHDGRLWFADWVAEKLYAVDEAGTSEIITHVPSLPFSIDWLPDGRLLIVNSRESRLVRREPDGTMVAHADLGTLSHHPWNEIVVDGRGNIYLNNIAFKFPGAEFTPGFVALLTPDGTLRQVADGLAFPNRHGRHARQQDADRRGILREDAHRLRHRARWQPLEPAGVGRARRPSRRHLH